MWSHYANSHQGFALAFDTDHEFFRNQTVPVVYSTARPHIRRGHWRDILRTKSVDWLYEREWRVIVNFVNLPAREKLVQPLPIRAIKAIFLGARTPPLTTKRIFDALQLSEYREVECYRMEVHQAEFKVIAKPVSIEEPNSNLWMADGI